MKRKMFTIIITLIITLLVSVISFIGGTHVDTEHRLNMNTVIDFEATEYGLMLYTNDGNGYYWER